ncbi:MAG TPA: RelA/SpoT family protein [Bacteroidales bacterium]|nr:RelA/SpoT family protein [Bacteroidales bacterium]
MGKTKTKIFTEEDISRIEAEYKSLKESLYRCDKPSDIALIDKAFRFANEAHRDMRRNSGEPYIIHPINVARIVNQEIGLGAKSVAAALMHDVVEDTDVTLETVEEEFGPKIASLIDGLTKISGTYNKEANSLQAENFRKMLMTLSDDIRVILIKIADRLHNMRTLESMPEHKRMKVAGETIYLYAPLAHRLGLFAIKTELEDLSFKFRHPRIYEEIARKIKLDEKKNITLINKFSLPIIETLNQNNIVFDISGRFKSIYSIWKKMQSKNVPFEEVFDLLAVRIVFEPGPEEVSERAQCWEIYSLITDIYTPKPDRLRDWVSRPNPNGYEALHLTVMGPGGRWVEVQIRSQRMDDIAEKGFAAHWKYKGDAFQSDSELDKWLKHIREMLANPMADPITFLDDFKMSLFSSEIMVFTPKGLLVNLPKGASALDFAYEIHTDVGNKAIGAKVNYKLSPLSTTLQSGDQVEIITSNIAKPEKDWLEYAHTTRAKGAIKDALKDESKDRIQKGMEMLEQKLSELGVVPNSDIIKKLLDHYQILSKDELYSRIGLGLINLDELRKVLKKAPEGSLKKYWKLAIGGVTKRSEPEKSEAELPAPIDKSHPYLLRENVDNTGNSYVIAECCNPIPGDEVIGYLAPDNSIVVHKPKCPTAIRFMSSEGNRIIPVRWTIHRLASFLARISINGIDRIGMVNEITSIISTELSVNIRNINFSVYNGIFEGTIDLYVHHTSDLNNLLMQLSNVKGVARVKRVEEFIE